MCMTCPEFAGGGDLHIWWVDANRPMCNTLAPGLKYLVHSANPSPRFKLQDLVFIRGKAYRKGGKNPQQDCTKCIQSSDTSYASFGVKGLIFFFFWLNFRLSGQRAFRRSDIT